MDEIVLGCVDEIVLGCDEIVLGWFLVARKVMWDSG